MTSRLDLLREFRRLAPVERRLLAQAWLTLHLIDIALRLLPFETVRAWCHEDRPNSPRQSQTHPPLSIARCAWLVGVAGRHGLVDATCLKQALAIARLMGRRGVATTLQIGVARSNGSLSAHAWLEQNGQIVFNLATAVPHAPLQPCRHEAF